MVREKPVEQVIFHVVFDDVQRQWRVEKEGANRPSAVKPTKEAAVRKARIYALNNRPSEVVVHEYNGSIAQRLNFVNNPETYLG